MCVHICACAIASMCMLEDNLQESVQFFLDTRGLGAGAQTHGLLADSLLNFSGGCTCYFPVLVCTFLLTSDMNNFLCTYLPTECQHW